MKIYGCLPLFLSQAKYGYSILCFLVHFLISRCLWLLDVHLLSILLSSLFYCTFSHFLLPLFANFWISFPFFCLLFSNGLSSFRVLSVSIFMVLVQFHKEVIEQSFYSPILGFIMQLLFIKFFIMKIYGCSSVSLSQANWLDIIL